MRTEKQIREAVRYVADFDDPPTTEEYRMATRAIGESGMIEGEHNLTMLRLADALAELAECKAELAKMKEAGL